MEQHSGIELVDKTAAVLRALAAGPCRLSELVTRTDVPRATAHRLAAALTVHGLVSSTEGQYALGPWIAELAGVDSLAARAVPVLDRLREHTGCSAQLFRRRGAERLCIAASDVPSGLRDTVPVGSRLPMTAGSAAQALLIDEEAPAGAAFTAATLRAARRRGWAQSVAERAPGVASVSAPVRGEHGAVVAAVSVSGPVSVLGRSPGKVYGPAVAQAAAALATPPPPP